MYFPSISLFPIICSLIFPQTVSDCRGSYGVDKGPLSSRWPRWRCEWAFCIAIYSVSWPHYQKHMVKWSIRGSFCIWRESGDDLWERCLLKLPGLLDASWVHPGCFLDAFWVLPGCILGSWMPPGWLLDACLNQLVHRSIHQFINPSIHQSINLSIHQSMNQTISQSNN